HTLNDRAWMTKHSAQGPTESDKDRKLFELAISFLTTSHETSEAESRANKERKREEVLRRARSFITILALVAVIAAGFTLYGYRQRNEAIKQAITRRQFYYVTSMRFAQTAFEDGN